MVRYLIRMLKITLFSSLFVFYFILISCLKTLDDRPLSQPWVVTLHLAVTGATASSLLCRVTSNTIQLVLLLHEPNGWREFNPNANQNASMRGAVAVSMRCRRITTVVRWADIGLSCRSVIWSQTQCLMMRCLVTKAELFMAKVGHDPPEKKLKINK